VDDEECAERIRLVEEYSRLVTEFAHILERLKAPASKLDDEIWRMAEEARAESQTAWAVLEKHIAEHHCIDLTRPSPELAINDSSSPRVSPVGALIAELVNEVPNDPSLQILRADLYAASHSYETTEKKDLALRFFLAIRALLSENARLRER